MNKRGKQHSTNGRQNRKQRIAKVRQLTYIQFTFDFKSHQQKKNGHQAIVHPMFYSILQINPEKRQVGIAMPEIDVSGRKRAISDDYRNNGSANQNKSTSFFTAKEFFE